MKDDQALKYLKDLYNITQQAIKYGDWKVDGSCDPDMLLREIERYLDNNFGKGNQPTIHVELPKDLNEEDFKQRVSPKIHIDLSGYSKPEDK